MEIISETRYTIQGQASDVSFVSQNGVFGRVNAGIRTPEVSRIRWFARLPPTRWVLTSLWILGEMKRDRAFGGICITLVIRVNTDYQKLLYNGVTTV